MTLTQRAQTIVVLLRLLLTRLVQPQTKPVPKDESTAIFAFGRCDEVLVHELAYLVHEMAATAPVSLGQPHRRQVSAALALIDELDSRFSGRGHRFQKPA